MATFESQAGVNSDWLFPALRGGSFTVVRADPDAFAIRYASDGNPGQGLIVTFVAVSPFDYDANNMPVGGAFNAITLSTAGPIPLPLASWTDLPTTSLSLFNEATLAQSLLNNSDSLLGGTGDDVLNGHGHELGGGAVDTYVGGGGDDTFILGLNSGGSIVHGANADGSGGDGETNTIKLVSSSALNTSEISNIDAVVFAEEFSLFPPSFHLRGRTSAASRQL